MAEVLGMQYFSVCQDPYNSLEDPDFIEKLRDNGGDLCEFNIDSESVRKIVSNLPLKSGPGSDWVPIQCLKYGGETVLMAIVEIGRGLLSGGKIPESLKNTWVTPVWKGSDKEDPKDYRPIAITNHLMKVIERVVRVQLVDYLTTTGFLDDEQHGGRAMRSTLSQLLDQNDWVVESLGAGSNVELFTWILARLLTWWTSLYWPPS